MAPQRLEPEPSPHVSLALAAEPANVSVVRGVVTALAETVGLAETDLDDVLTATSEAVNNVVLHAYPDRTGPFWIELRADPHELVVVVRDRGCGLRQYPSPKGPGMGTLSVGLAAMAAFSGHLEFCRPAGGGTEIRMGFAASCSRPPPPLSGPPPQAPDVDHALPGAWLSTRPAALGGPVLVRLVVALAARSGFTVDRLSDVGRVAAGLAAAAAEQPSMPELTVTVGFDRSALDLVFGPLGPGAGHALLAGAPLHGGGSLAEHLADHVAVERQQAGELLRVVLFDRQPATVRPRGAPPGS